MAEADHTPADAPWVDAGGQRLRCGDLVAYLNPDPAMRYFGRIRALIHDDGAPYVVLQGHPLVDGNDDVPCSMVALVDELALAELGFRVTPEPDSAADRTPNELADALEQLDTLRAAIGDPDNLRLLARTFDLPILARIAAAVPQDPERCACGKPATGTVGGVPTCGDDR